MINIVVYDTNDRRIGEYTSCVVPRENEILDANNGRWKVLKVQHDIRGALSITEPSVFQTSVIVYAEATLG
jgi:hypothetical protein